jgi:hypothetical protein
MPILEVIQSAAEPATTEQKRAFARSALEIFRDVLGTPEGRLRVFFYPLAWEDNLAGLLESEPEEDS